MQGAFSSIETSIDKAKSSPGRPALFAFPWQTSFKLMRPSNHVLRSRSARSCLSPTWLSALCHRLYLPPQRKASHLSLPTLVIEDPLDTAASEIFPGKLYVGGEAAVASAERLGVTHVVRMARTAMDCGAARRVYAALLQGGGSEGALADKLLEVLTPDDWDAQVNGTEMVDFIVAAVAGGGCVLVHCREGISRSAAAVLLFLVARKTPANFDDPTDDTVPPWRRCYPLASALAYLKHQRPGALPNAAILGKVAALEFRTHHAVTLNLSHYIAEPRRFMQEAVTADAELQRVWTREPLCL
ncbi:unnamed protein product [Phaeothamnion confervicola]